jgi:O-antigen/teichoic acid export membrane protein
MLLRDANFKTISIINTAKAVAGLLVVVAFAIAGFSSLSLAYGQIASAALGAILYNLFAKRYVSYYLSIKKIIPIVLFGFQMMTIGGVANLANKLSEIFLGYILGVSALGMYTRASSISLMIFSNVYGLATRVIFIKLAADLRERGTLHDTFLMGIRMITAVMWPLLIGLAVLARPAVYLLYGEKWLESAMPLSLLMIAQAVVLGFGMNWELFVLRNETARQTRFELIRALVGLLTFGAGCLFGIAQAALGRIAEAAFGYMLYRPHMDKLAGTKPGELENVYRDSFELTFAAVFPSFILMILTKWSHLTPPLFIAGAILLGISFWAAVLLLRAHPLIGEFRLLFARVRT